MYESVYDDECMDLSVLSTVDECFRSFTQTKMKKLFEISAFAHLFKYYILCIFSEREGLDECNLDTYCHKIIQDSTSSRLSRHKAIGKNFTKYRQIIQKLLAY